MRQRRLLLSGIVAATAMCWLFAPPAALARSLDSIKARNALSVCAHPNALPFSSKNGERHGIEIELAEVLAKELGVGLDTANLILYGKANPVDAVDILGPHIRSVHAKDGRWPTNPSLLGEEVLIGKGLVNFRNVFTKLHKLGYTGAITIERETSGPQQIADVREEKLYLERILHEVLV